MVDKDLSLRSRGVKVAFPVVDLYYSDPLPVFNFTGIQLSKEATASSGIVLISTLDPIDPRLGIVAELNLTTSGLERTFTNAYSTVTEGDVTITGAEGIHKKRDG